MSDLMEMGDLVALFDGNVTSRINPESLRRATPFLIKNSCFNSKFERFPGFTTAPDFEAVSHLAFTKVFLVSKLYFALGVFVEMAAGHDTDAVQASLVAGNNGQR